MSYPASWKLNGSVCCVYIIMGDCDNIVNYASIQRSMNYYVTKLAGLTGI